MSEKDINFEDKLWKAADKLRKKVEVHEYKYVVLGLERVFQDIKKHLKNKLFYLIEEFENAVCKIVNSFTPQTLKKLTFYPYIKEAFLE